MTDIVRSETWEIIHIKSRTSFVRKNQEENLSSIDKGIFWAREPKRSDFDPPIVPNIPENPKYIDMMKLP